MQTEVLKRDEFLESDKKLPVIVGQDESGKLIIEDLRDINNLLVVGQVGTPRVPFNYALICGIGQNCSPEEVKMPLIDFYGAELGGFGRFPHTKFTLPNFEVNGSVTYDYDKCLYALDRLAKEAVYRYHKIKELGAQNIEEYNEKAKEKMSYIVCVVEYPHKVKKKDIEVVEGFINQITNFSKESGICFVYTMKNLNQYDDNDETYEVLTENMINNFNSKIVFNLREIDKKLFKDFKIDADEEFRKHWFVKQNTSPQKIEMPHFGEDEFGEILRNLK